MCSYFSEGGDLSDIVRALGFRNSTAQCQITQVEATRVSTEGHGNYTFSKDSESSGLVKDLIKNDEEAEIRQPDVFSTVLQISTDEVKPQLQVPIRVTDQEVVHIFSPHVLGAKRRKTLAKKVVLIAAPSGELVPTDLWAWRKYGQKPIKGSPYPRGYYRCSSSKGCPARKQVERSIKDPKMLVITYTSDHNHPWPIQRNSLAGSTRVRPVKGRSAARESSSSEEKRPSPPSLVTFPSLKEEDLDINKGVVEDNDKVLMNTSSKLDDFFMDLGDLDALDPLELVFSFKAQRDVEMKKNDA